MIMPPKTVFSEAFRLSKKSCRKLKNKKLHKIERLPPHIMLRKTLRGLRRKAVGESA